MTRVPVAPGGHGGDCSEDTPAGWSFFSLVDIVLRIEIPTLAAKERDRGGAPGLSGPAAYNLHVLGSFP